MLRIKRVASVTDCGQIVNEKLARNQLIGGTIGRIAMATFEQTVTDAGSGQVANATLAVAECLADNPEGPMQVVLGGKDLP